MLFHEVETPSYPLRRRWIEQHCFVEVEGEGNVLAGAYVGIGAHPGGHFLAGDLCDDESIRAGRLDNIDMRIERRHALGMAIGAFRIADRLGPDAENDRTAI